MKVIPFFLVWNPIQPQLRNRHDSYDKAKTEALRLAKLYLGQEFFVLSVTGRAKTIKQTDWTSVLEEKEA